MAMHGGPRMRAVPSNGYTFQSQPRPVQGRRRKKYRDDDSSRAPQSARSTNLMHDKRVRRGRPQPTVSRFEEEAMAPVQKEPRRRRKRTASRQRPRTPPPVAGRQHTEVQTMHYLEELTARPTEKDMSSQTDPLLDRPSSPLFIPQPSGPSVATQIEKGDLFDFDREVAPILEVLVGKTLDQSLMQVLEEEELASLERHQREFEQIRNAELAEMQRLEQAEKRRYEEKERRMKQARDRRKREEEAARKVAARAAAKDYLETLEADVFETLEKGGHFYDPVEREVETQFMPWLVDAVVVEMKEVRQARFLVDNLLAAAIALGEQRTAQALTARDEEIAEKKALASERERQARQQEAEALKQKELAAFVAAQSAAADADED